VSSKATSVRIVDALRESILDGVLPPGLQVRQEALAEQFGVSRVPVREALRQLEAEGLIHTELHKGAFVSSLSLEQVIEMLDIRIGLELRALKLAVPNFTAQHAGAAKRILERYDASASPRDWRDLNLAFHLALYAPCNRPRLVKMIEDVALGTHRFLRTYVSAIVGREDPQAEHHRLLELCVDGDAAGALALLEAHIERTKTVLLRHRTEHRRRVD
jgi:DNA-binding GntR family transcriptional regulator